MLLSTFYAFFGSYILLTFSRNDMSHIDLGKSGEDLALKYLLEQDYKFMDRNYRYGKGELDLVMQQGNELVVVEVKTRSSEKYGSPIIAVSRKKQQQIIKVANSYIAQNQIDKEVRFDVISIIINQYERKVEHICNAFYPF